MSSSKSIAAGLALVSIVIDIERIGDLTKNIVDLALRHPGKLDCGSLEPDVRRIETTVKTMFSLLIEALPKGDEAKAKEVMSEHGGSPAVRRDPRLPDRPRGSESVCSDAVTIALYVRYLKRVSAHLMNIASSLVNPFDRIGFREDDLGTLTDDE